MQQTDRQPHAHGARIAEGKTCPNCATAMHLHRLPGHYGREIEIDVCHDCNAIWFDPWESSQLSADGTVGLFQLIHQRGGTASSSARTLDHGLRCVTCQTPMRRVNDMVRSTRFVYQSCPHGHGRFTTFYNFLAEKQFVRELTRAERQSLRATVRQIQCSSCGAPIDLAHEDACGYCRATVAVFDRDAARKAIDHYLAQRSGREHTGARTAPAPWPPETTRRDHWRWHDAVQGGDLAADLLWALSRAFSRWSSPRTATSPNQMPLATATDVLLNAPAREAAFLSTAAAEAFAAVGSPNTLPGASQVLRMPAHAPSEAPSDALTTFSPIGTTADTAGAPLLHAPWHGCTP
ncbi:MAG: zf-TFIIB domain-containing protein, partial [Casimicrobiaceae bacterium]